jgi:hypothetical protein
MQVEIEQEFSEPQLAIFNSIATINLFLAGVGSGKTHLDGLISKQLISSFPEARGGIFANTYDQLNTSTLFRIREYWASTGMTEWSKENPNGVYVSGKEPPAAWTKCKRNFDRFTNIISFCNGALIFTGSLDNAVMHSGKEMAWSILDETKDSREEDVKEIILSRLRQPGMYLVDGVIKNSGTQAQQWNPLYISTSPAKVPWIAEWFELESYIDEISAQIYSDKTFFQKAFKDKFVTISSTYHNVHNVGENYIKKLLSENTEEKGKALVYANPFVTTGGEFYSSFNRLKHVSPVKYNPEIPIHISFDQNSVPYNSAGISQIVRDGNNWQWRFIDEIALVNPHNSTEEVCDEFMRRYPKHKAGLYYYGDASGHNRTVMNKDFKHHYQVIEAKLRNYLVNGSDRSLFKNPSCPMRRDFINRIFEDKLPIRVVIDDSCHHLIGDLMYCKQGLDGGKDKHIVTDKDTGEKYQKYGHFGDCFTGNTKVITTKGGKDFSKLVIGERVLTRNGYKKITAFYEKGLRTVNKYKIGNRIIECTAEHKIFANGEFIMVSSLINKNINTIFARKRTWKGRLFLWMGINSIDTRMQRNHQTETITKDGLKRMEFGEKQAFIFTFGKRLMERFRRDLWFIMTMANLKITRLEIISLSVVRNIYKSITNGIRRSLKTKTQKDLSKRQSPKQLNGISLRPVRSGIEKTLINLYTQTNILKSVLDAERNSNQTYEKNQNGVQENASLNIKQEKTEQKENIKKKEYAKPVGEFSRLINGIQINSVHVPVSRIGKSKKTYVYDITVEQDHEFFANGVLVHNCFEYMAVELFKNYYNG